MELGQERRHLDNRLSGDRAFQKDDSIISRNLHIPTVPATLPSRDNRAAPSQAVPQVLSTLLHLPLHCELCSSEICWGGRVEPRTEEMTQTPAGSTP